MSNDAPFREMIGRMLSWEDAHAGFESAVKGLPAKLRGTKPSGVPYSPWEILEHLRITQHDILDFCVNPDYEEMEWPRDYWPAAAEPPSPEAWDDSVRAFLADREALQALAADSAIDLGSRIPHGKDQT